MFIHEAGALDGEAAGKVSVEARIIEMRRRAVLVEYDGSPHWLPLAKVLIERRRRCAAGFEYGTVTVPRWIAEDRGWLAWRPRHVRR